MHTIEDITIDSITKIEGNAALKIKIENGLATDVQFIISDYRRFYTDAVIGKPYNQISSLLSRICGTCSIAHLLASIKSIEKALGIHNQISEQTRLIRKLAMNGMMIRDHALHLYIFSLPDVLGIDSVLDIAEDSPYHQILHDAFDLKAVGNKLSTIFAGAAIHAPFPVVGGTIHWPSREQWLPLIDELEQSRDKIMRGIKLFAEWDKSLCENTDFVALVNDDFSFTEGKVSVNNEKFYSEEEFVTLFEEVIKPYTQSKSYTIKDKNSDYMVGAIARLNLNKDKLHIRTKGTLKDFCNIFPTNNIFYNNLAQAIEILHCIDESIDILHSLNINPDEKNISIVPYAGTGIGVIEAPRGILYHKAVTNDQGIIIDADVIVPTSQNQFNIENSLKKMVNEKLNQLSREDIKLEAEKIVRAYDPCMSCSTNFLKIIWE